MDAPVIHLPLVRPPFFTVRVLLVLAAVGALGLLGAFIVSKLLPTAPGPLAAVGYLAILGGLVVTASGAVLGFRWITRPAEGGVIEIHPDHLVLPVNADSRNRDVVPFEAIRALDVRVGSSYGLLLLDTDRHLYLFRKSRFRDDAALEIFHTALQARLSAHPEGARIVAGLAERQSRGNAAFERSPVATHALLLLIGAGFLVQSFAGAAEGTFSQGLLRLGSNAPALIKEGELYRLVVANLLHSGSFHLIVNAFALWSFGSMVERVIGPWRFAALFLLTGLVATAASATVSQGLQSVGASGAVFGLLGGYAVVMLRHRGELPAGFRLHARWWLFIIGINGALLLVPIIDWAGHVGGFAGGLVVGWVLCRSPEAVDPRRATPAWIRTVALASATIYAAGIAAAVQHAGVHSGEEDAHIVLRSIMDAPEAQPGDVNNVAWMIALDPNAGPLLLSAAHEGAKRAVAARPNEPALLDTLAQTHRRLGRHDEAVEIERALVEADPENATWAGQLARFLHSRVHLLGPRAQGSHPLAAVDVTIEAKGEVTVRAFPPPPEPYVAYAVVSNNGAPVGLLRICLSPQTEASATHPPKAGSIQRHWPPELKVTVGDLRPSRCGGPEVRAWGIPREALAWP